MTRRREKLEDNHRWELAVAHLKRSDEAATYLRALLFALASGSIAFIFTQIKDAAPQFVLIMHLVAVVAFGIAVAVLIRSWVVQKYKAGKRFEILRDGSENRYRAFNRKMDALFWSTNHKLDLLAAWLIGVGALSEMIAKIASVLIAGNIRV